MEFFSQQSTSLDQPLPQDDDFDQLLLYRKIIFMSQFFVSPDVTSSFFSHCMISVQNSFIQSSSDKRASMNWTHVIALLFAASVFLTFASCQKVENQWIDAERISRDVSENLAKIDKILRDQREASRRMKAIMNSYFVRV